MHACMLAPTLHDPYAQPLYRPMRCHAGQCQSSANQHTAVQQHAACMHACMHGGPAINIAHLPLQDHPPHNVAQRPQVRPR